MDDVARAYGALATIYHLGQQMTAHVAELGDGRDLRELVHRMLTGSSGAFVTLEEALRIGMALDRAQRRGHPVVSRHGCYAAFDQYCVALQRVVWPDSRGVELRWWDAAVDGPSRSSESWPTRQR